MSLVSSAIKAAVPPSANPTGTSPPAGRRWGIGGSSQAGATGLTTAQLQSGSANAGLGSAFGGGTGGLYPYLLSFFPNGVQAVSGIAYTNAGATPLASGTAGAGLVSVAANGAALGTVSTGVNGYYYVAVAAGTIADGNAVAAYTQANSATGAQNGVHVITAAGPATTGPVLSGFNVYGGFATVTTPLTTYSAASAAYANTLSSEEGIEHSGGDGRLGAAGGLCGDRREFHGRHVARLDGFPGGNDQRRAHRHGPDHALWRQQPGTAVRQRRARHQCADHRVGRRQGSARLRREFAHQPHLRPGLQRRLQRDRGDPARR